MKFTTLAALLPFLPSAISAAAVPSQETTPKLHKRLYTSTWAIQKSVNRFILQGGNDRRTPCGFITRSTPPEDLTTDTQPRFLTWDGYPGRETGDRRPQIEICTETFRCLDVTSVPAKYESTGVECPPTEEEFIQKLMDGIASSRLDITVEDVHKRLHEIDPEAFPFKTLEEKKAAEAKGSEQPKPKEAPAAETGVEAPGWTQDGVVKDCKKWTLARENNSCYAIAEHNNLELAKFYEWNQAVNKKGPGGECSELWVGYAYCVGV
ncbi:hypothetical protein BJ508DRAFT_326737 [Ascobolus immersus RN42]|uniref:LysM domain-containing protein n=1 Tax=Ascobolus immersus RN42 TaxID=1160509 RepID=A0A3N4I6Q1_ASCIM|nr:hypothetical protein BJ508DRAFT_326737 [Ascobolus immersus RN42]